MLLHENEPTYATPDVSSRGCVHVLTALKVSMQPVTTLGATREGRWRQESNPESLSRLPGMAIHHPVQCITNKKVASYASNLPTHGDNLTQPPTAL